jgi:predicted nucleic-acid-binding Zn-ribbon protein
MLTIISKSTEKCFVCRSTQNSVQVKIQNPKFVGTLCMKCVYERIPDGKEVNNVESQDSG